MKHLNIYLLFFIGCIVLLFSCDCEPCDCQEGSAPLVLELPDTRENTSPKNTIDVFVTEDNTYLVFNDSVHKDSLLNVILDYREINMSETIKLHVDKLASWEAGTFVMDIANEKQMKIVIKTEVK